MELTGAGKTTLASELVPLKRAKCRSSKKRGK